MAVASDPARLATDLIGDLKSAIGVDHVVTSPEELRWFAADFTDSDVPMPIAVAQPATTDEVVRIVRIARAAGLAVAPRGGGMSYVLAHTPARAETLIVDTRRMDRIVEVNAEDRYVTVEAGVTWAQLLDALQGTGLWLAFGGTLSGLHATVAGTISQNSVGLGRGFLSERVLALEVVLGDGRVLHTGSGAATGSGPFTRTFGPDLGALFVADSGIFGVKTRATLLLDPAPRGTAFGCFAFDDARTMIQTQVDLGRTVPLSECIGADSFMNSVFAETPPPPKAEVRRVARAVLTSGDSKPRALRQLVSAARPGGMKYLAKVPFSLVVICDAASQAGADHTMRQVRRLVRRHGGRRLPTGMALGLRHAPFQPIHPLMVGQKGEAGFPSNALLPLSKGEAALDTLDRFEAEHGDVMREHGITLVRNFPLCGHMFGVEPIFFWPDRLSPYRASWASDEQRARFADAPANPAGRAAVLDLRRQLIAEFRELGAVHIQIGKVYPYRDALVGSTAWDVMNGIKSLLDPDRIVNPGGLGLE